MSLVLYLQLIPFPNEKKKKKIHTVTVSIIPFFEKGILNGGSLIQNT